MGVADCETRPILPRQNPGSIGRHARVAFDDRVMHLDGATHRIDRGTKLDESAIHRTLYDARLVDPDRRVDPIAPQCAQPCERAILVDVGLPAESYHVGAEDRGASFRDSVIVPRSTITRSESPFSANKRQFSAAAGTGAQAPFLRGDANDRSLRIAVVHCALFERQKSPLSSRSDNGLGCPSVG